MLTVEGQERSKTKNRRFSDNTDYVQNWVIRAGSMPFPSREPCGPRLLPWRQLDRELTS